MHEFNGNGDDLSHGCVKPPLGGLLALPQKADVGTEDTSPQLP
jgi:hypothetical protein